MDIVMNGIKNLVVMVTIVEEEEGEEWKNREGS